MTYLLGVGDRHLDNLLLTPDGKWNYDQKGSVLNIGFTGHFFHGQCNFVRIFRATDI